MTFIVYITEDFEHMSEAASRIIIPQMKAVTLQNKSFLILD